MKLRNTFSILLVLSLVFALFTGCGNSDTSADRTTNAAPSAEAANLNDTDSDYEEADEESVSEALMDIVLPITDEVTTYTLFTGVDPRVVDLVDLDNLSSEYKGYAAIKELTNIDFDITAIAAMAFSEQFQLMIAGGDYCDVLYGVQDNYATNINGALEDEVIIDLYDLIKENAPHLWNNYVMEYNDLKARLINNNGQIGAMPLLLGEPGQENAGNAIRKDWLDAMNMSEPKSLEQLEDYLYAAYEKYGAYINLTSDCNFSPLATAMGFTVDGFYRNDSELILGWTSEKAFDYLTTLHQWYVDGLVNPDFMSVEMPAIQSGIANDLYSIASVNGASDMMTLYSYTDNEKVEFCGVGSLPMQEGGEITYGSANSIVKNVSEWSVSVACANPIPLIKMLDYLYTNDGRVLNTWGTEGVSYTLDTAGNPQWTDLIVNNPDGYSYVVARTIFAGAGIPGILDMSRDYYAFGDLEWAAYDTFLGVDADINNLPGAAQYCMTADELADANAIYTDMETYMNEVIAKWVVGSEELTEEAFATFVETLEGMGLEDYTTFYQTAYERYLKKIA